MANLYNKDLLLIRPVFFFIIIALFQMTITILTYYTFYDLNVLYNSYANQLTYDRIADMFETQKRYLWIMSVIIPLSLLFKIFYNAFLILTGSILYDSKGDFRATANVLLKAEYVFVIMLFVKFLVLGFFKEVNILDDLSFVPGSLASLYKVSELPKWAVYPLQTLNIWEVLFCWVGTTLYALQFDVPKAMAFQRFCVPYLIGLFIWVLVVVFITLQFS